MSLLNRLRGIREQADQTVPKEKKPHVKRTRREYFDGTPDEMAEKVGQMFREIREGETIRLDICRSGPIGGPYNRICLSRIIPVDQDQKH